MHLNQILFLDNVKRLQGELDDPFVIPRICQYDNNLIKHLIGDMEEFDNLDVSIDQLPLSIVT